jgi:hypothetical protein
MSNLEKTIKENEKKKKEQELKRKKENEKVLKSYRIK